MYMGFFLTAIWRCWLLLQRTKNDPDAWFADSARMTIASLAGFMVAAQFVSLEALEIPYYVVLLGAGSVTIQHRLALASSAATTQYAELSAVETADADSEEVITSVTADGTESAQRFSFHETTAITADARSQSADWRDAIDRMPQKLDGVEHPLVMN
jgi:hypothetical protein